jgi:hypothetical protein
VASGDLTGGGRLERAASSYSDFALPPPSAAANGRPIAAAAELPPSLRGRQAQREPGDGNEDGHAEVAVKKWREGGRSGVGGEPW